jgi:glutamate racemase
VDAILITCSTMNRSYPAVARTVDVPVVQIDMPMMEAAANQDGKVLVIATLVTTRTGGYRRAWTIWPECSPISESNSTRVSAILTRGAGCDTIAASPYQTAFDALLAPQPPVIHLP